MLGTSTKAVAYNYEMERIGFEKKKKKWREGADVRRNIKEVGSTG